MDQDSEEEGALNESQKQAICRIANSYIFQIPRIQNRGQINILNFIEEQNQPAINFLDFIPRNHQMYDSYIIIGPPGTGKTTVISLGALKYALEPPVGHRQGTPRVFICTYSNAAANRIFDCFMNLFAEIGYNRYGSFIRRIYAQSYELAEIPQRFHPFLIRPYAETNQDETTHFRQLQETLIFVGTVYACGDLGVRNIHAKHVIFDEASQITPPQLYYPIARNNNVIRIGVIGDNCQLPPIQELSRLTYSGMELLMGLATIHSSIIPERNRLILNYQYRMHPAIRELAMRFSAPERIILDGFNVLRLDYLLHGFESLPTFNQQINDIFHPQKTVVVINTSRLGSIAEDIIDGTSRYNPAEVQIISGLVQLLRQTYPNLDLTSENLKIVSPYSVQADYLETETGITSGTADRFQGQEASIILLSLTFADYNISSRFLTDLRRLNVALSRAQRKLIIVGNRSLLNDPYFSCIQQDIFGFSYEGPPVLNYNPVHHYNIDIDFYNYLRQIS